MGFYDFFYDFSCIYAFFVVPLHANFARVHLKMKFMYTREDEIQ